MKRLRHTWYRFRLSKNRNERHDMNDALQGLYFFSRFAVSFSALGHRRQRLFWKDKARDFRDQCWLVTGASGGIGRAIAQGAAAGGARVIAAARSEEKLSKLIAVSGANVSSRPTDLSSTREIKRLLDQLAAIIGHQNVDLEQHDPAKFVASPVRHRRLK